MRTTGDIVGFAESRQIAVRFTDMNEIATAKSWGFPCLESSGGTLVLMPWDDESVARLCNMGHQDACRFSGIMDIPDRPLVEGRYQPLEHQLLTAAFITMNSRCYVLSEPRLGKTGSTILAMDYLQRRRLMFGGVLVITTYTTMRGVWERAVQETLPSARIQIVHGRGREAALEATADWYITNYDSVRLSRDSYIDAVREGRIGAVVIDELTHVGNSRSKRSEAIYWLCAERGLSRVVGLTGSPADNIDAVYGMAKVVNQNALPCRSYTAWQELTTYQYGMASWQRAPRADAGEVISRTLRPSIRYRKSDVLDLPPVTEQVRQCELSAEQKKMLKDLEAEAVALLSTGETITAANGGVLLQRALQVSQGIIKVTDDDGNSHAVQVEHAERTQMILDIIAETTRKVVIFSPYVAGCHMIADEVKAAGHSVRVITGEVSGRRRADILYNFQNAIDPRVLVCHPITVGFGTELSAADTMIFSVPLMLGGFTYNQALERLSSVKQKAENVNIIHIIGGPMEQRVLSQLQAGHKAGEVIAEFFEAITKKSLTS